MGYQALYRAWRPLRFSDVVGQQPIVTTLVHQIETGHIAHAYLFCGSRGTGKTSTAKVFARAINCAHPVAGEACGECEACRELQKENNMDVIEIDAASNNGVDEIRALREKIVYPPSVGRYKVYIIDEVHMLSSGAFNALLKTLEEPPSHAVFVLATTEPQKLPATILSRCQRFDFKRIAAKLIAGRLAEVLQSTGATAEPEALGEIARSAEGGMRDALSLLDMCLSYGAGEITVGLVHDVLGATSRAFLFEFVQCLIDGDAKGALMAIDKVIMDGRDPAVFSREVTAHLRALLLAQVVTTELAEMLEIAEEDAERYHHQAKTASRSALMRQMELFMEAESNMKWAAAPRAVLELCAMRACHPQRDVGDEALLARIDKLERALAEGVQVAAQPAPAKAKAPRPEKEPMPPAPKAPEGAPAAAEDDQWKKLKELVSERVKPAMATFGVAKYLGRDDASVSIEIPKAYKMYKPILDMPFVKGPMEEVLLEVYGCEMHLRATVAGDHAAPQPKASGQKLTNAFEVFGRENVIVRDE